MKRNLSIFRSVGLSILLYVVLVITIDSCSTNDIKPNPGSQLMKRDRIMLHDDNGRYSVDINTFRLDGCEYYIYQRSMCHKGNCDNPKHIYNK